jgi:hypothetical protein
LSGNFAVKNRYWRAEDFDEVQAGYRWPAPCFERWLDEHCLVTSNVRDQVVFRNVKALALSVGYVECRKLSVQDPPLGFGAAIEVTGEHGGWAAPWAGFPGFFETVADRIDAGRRFGRELLILGGLTQAHVSRSYSSCFHRRRMRWTLRSIVRSTQSSRSAISSFVYPSTFHKAICLKLLIVEQSQQAAAFVGNLECFLRSRLAREQLLDVLVAGDFTRTVTPDQVDGAGDRPGRQKPPQVIAARQFERPGRIAEMPLHAVKRPQRTSSS